MQHFLLRVKTQTKKCNIKKLLITECARRRTKVKTRKGRGWGGGWGGAYNTQMIKSQVSSFHVQTTSYITSWRIPQFKCACTQTFFLRFYIIIHHLWKCNLCINSVSHNAQLGVYYAQISTLDAHISSQCVWRTQRVFSPISTSGVSIDQLDQSVTLGKQSP